MADTNQLYELTRMIDDKQTMESEFSDIFQTLRQMIQKKYVNKLHHVVESEQRDIKEHPPKEVNLLKAMREFTPPEQRQGFDRLIDMAMLMNTASKMRGDLSYIAEQSKPSVPRGNELTGSLHAMENEPNTLEESANITGILLTMALMKMI